MFDKCDFRTLELKDGMKFVGIVRSNDIAVQREFYLTPFVRDLSAKMILRIGTRNYNLCDQFIVASLNDYYKRINEAKNDAREMMLANYNRLYQSFTILNQAKQTHNYKMMEDCYDSLSYQLYLLGYKMSNS